MMAPIALVVLVFIAVNKGMRRSLLLLPDGQSNRSALYHLKRTVGLLVIYIAPPVVLLTA